MNARSVPACLCWLVAISEPISAQNPALAEKIRDVSPDKKFAMQISYDAAMYQQIFPDAGKTSFTLQRNIQEEYFSDTIKAVELVSLPKKVVVADLPWDGSPNQTRLIWSRDSKWCAFYAETPRWVSPGCIICAATNSSDRESRAKATPTYRLTAEFDEKTGNLRIVSKKKLPSKE
jgi:hypothetical protein